VCLVTRLVILQRSLKHDRRHQSVPLDPDNTVMSLIAGIRALVIEFFYSAYVHHPQILSQGTFSGISDIEPSPPWCAACKSHRISSCSRHWREISAILIEYIAMNGVQMDSVMRHWKVDSLVSCWCTIRKERYFDPVCKDVEEICCDIQYQGVTSMIFRDNACYHISQDWM
jgi:hypothetical protein